MHFRSILSGTLAILLLSGATAPAGERIGLLNSLSSDQVAANTGLLPKLGLPKLFGGSKEKAPVELAQQVGDPRITALEEQVRSLSGTIEELNFQILQMQEQLRKMQEDNEFRFQELEQKKTDAGTKTDRNVVETPPAETGRPAAGETAAAPPAQTPAPAEEVIVDDGSGNPAPVPSTETAPGVPPKTFGTITFDDKGNVTGGSVGDQMTEAPAPDAAPAERVVREATPNAPEAASGMQADDTIVAALPATDDPEELYRNSYEFILSGDYGTAEAGFRNHISRFPADPKTADARFWLGESLLGQKKYRDAAETFLSANKEYPSSKKAPDMLLKLGVSLVGLDQRDVACATFSEIGRRYPDTNGALKDRIKQEQALAKC